jgi:SAM-dependent methyltransferase
VDPIETSTHTESTPGVLITRLGQGYVQPSLLAWRVREAALYRVPDDAIALDLGAGYGHFTHAVAPRAIAVDLALDQLQAGLAAGNYRAAVCADISALPFRPGSAETVLSNCVLEHLVDLPGALRELRRTLTPAGSLQTTVPLAAINDAYIIPSERYRALRNRQLAHRTLEDSAGWRRLFASAGLEVKHETTAVTEGEARRWDALDAPLFAGVRGKTAFGGYVRILDRYPRLRRLNRRLAARMAAWILGGRRGSDDPPVCAFFDLRPNEPM